MQLAYRKRKSAGELARMVKREVTCDGCGKSFIAEHPRARWCSKKCANRHWGLVRSRQRGRPSTARYTDREIFERDGWVCQICQRPVDREAKRLHPDGATIDHVVPLPRGGSDEPTNIVTAHWRCNRDKRARMTV
jgi:5-methylcytosine-specific restriction endonuclease McrA